MIRSLVKRVIVVSVDGAPTKTSGPLNVLLVDDSADDAEIVVRELRRSGREIMVERVFDASAMRASLGKKPWDLVLSDWSMPSFSGAAALEVLKSAGLDVPFIIVSGTVTEELAIKAMRAGARDWVLKGKLARLLPAVERELTEGAERKRVAEALRRSDERLRQSQKMEAIGGLAAGVAHDFNNVLSVILGYADLLLATPKLSTEMREDLDEIRNATVRASELTRQLLAFSRQQVLEPRKTDLNHVVAGMGKMLRRLVGEDVELNVLADAQAGLVLVDPGQMEQVILNLAVNARDAMPRGGTLTIRTANVHVAEAGAGAGARPGLHVMLAMSDTGVGMDTETKSRIFEPFFTTKEPGRGTGLGLATVFGILEQSGGTIWCDSEPGRGTTFTMYLPQLGREGGTDTSLSEPAPRRREPLGGIETILLVEDDEAVRVLTRTVLQKQGYRVLDASSGDDALALAEANPDAIDLVVTDVVMPRMSGREFADRLWSVRPGLKVIFMSGYTAGAIVQHGVLEPGIAFLQKPIAPDILIRKVRDVLSSTATDAPRG